MTISFAIISALLISTALAVVLLKNPIHSALALVLNLIGVAVVFAMLDAHFLAMVQIIVYGGAIMVLVVFVLMLINVKTEERTFGTWFQLVLSGIAASCFTIMIMKALSTGLSAINSAGLRNGADSSLNAVPLEGTVQLLGHHLFTRYLLSFEAASILIMAAIVAATMLAKAEKPKEHKSNKDITV